MVSSVRLPACLGHILFTLVQLYIKKKVHTITTKGTKTRAHYCLFDIPRQKQTPPPPPPPPPPKQQQQQQQHRTTTERGAVQFGEDQQFWFG